MKPLSVWLPGALAAAGLVVGLLAQGALIRVSSHPVSVTPWFSAMFLLLGLWLLVVGLGIRKLKARTHTWVSPVLAGRTALLARAAAPLSSFFAGALAGIAIVSFGRSWAPYMTGAAWSALVAALSAAFAAVVALLVERWAALDGDQDGQDRAQGAGSDRAIGEPG